MNLGYPHARLLVHMPTVFWEPRGRFVTHSLGSHPNAFNICSFLTSCQAALPATMQLVVWVVQWRAHVCYLREQNVGVVHFVVDGSYSAQRSEDREKKRIIVPLPSSFLPSVPKEGVLEHFSSFFPTWCYFYLLVFMSYGCQVSWPRSTSGLLPGQLTLAALPGRKRWMHIRIRVGPLVNISSIFVNQREITSVIYSWNEIWPLWVLSSKRLRKQSE